MDEKKNFIHEWKQQEVSLAELCRRYEISRQTGYKWIERYEEGESMALRYLASGTSPSS